MIPSSCSVGPSLGLPAPQQWMVLGGQGASARLEVAGAGDGAGPGWGRVAGQLRCPAQAGPTPDLCGQLEVSGGSSEPLLQDSESPPADHVCISDSCHGPEGLWSCPGQSLPRRWASWQHSVRRKPVSCTLKALRSAAAQSPAAQPEEAPRMCQVAAR